MAFRPLNLVSICTGGAGLDLGVGLAVPGARSVCMVEREAFAVARLVSAMQAGLLHPAPLWSDVRTFDGRPWRGRVDGLIGGIPCQPHSLAGRKRGQHDARDLWSPTRRIIGQARPWLVLIENVGGMLSKGADEIAGAERVWRDLRKLGFAVEAGLFPASEVGAPHERERIFILGVADSDDEPGRGQLGIDGGAGARPREQSDWSRAELADAGCDGRRERCPVARLQRRQAGADASRNGPLAEPAGTRRQGRGPAGSGSGECATAERGGGDVGDANGSHQHVQPETRRSRHPVGEPGGDVVHAALVGRREGRTEPELRGGWRAAAGADGTMADALDRGEQQSQGAIGEEWRRAGNGRAQLPLFPPSPGDREGWGRVIREAPHLEPAVRGVVDGLAPRVDRLRLLGNGVVPLAAAYAFRTLVHRLAAAGSGRANQLVRMMETGE